MTTTINTAAAPSVSPRMARHYADAYPVLVRAVTGLTALLSDLGIELGYPLSLQVSAALEITRAVAPARIMADYQAMHAESCTELTIAHLEERGRLLDQLDAQRREIEALRERLAELNYPPCKW